MTAAAAPPTRLAKNAMMSCDSKDLMAGASVLIEGRTDAPYRLDARLAWFMLLVAAVTIVLRKRHGCLGRPSRCNGQVVTCRSIQA